MRIRLAFVLGLAVLASGCLADTPFGIYDCLWSPGGLTCVPIERAIVKSGG